MKKALGILMAAVVTVAAMFAMFACGDTPATQGNSATQTELVAMQADIDKLSDTVATLTEKVDGLSNENKTLTETVNGLTNENKTLTGKVNGLTSENKTLTGKVNDLTNENSALKDRVDGLNVFWTDKAEYEEHETMTVYFNNKPVVKIRLNFDTLKGTPLWGGSPNFELYITSLYTDIYDEAIIGTVLLVCDSGTFTRKPSSNPNLLKQNKETATGGYFGAYEAYEKATWFDLVICVPGTLFELARFKNVSFTK